MFASSGYHIHPMPLFKATIPARSPGNDPRGFPGDVPQLSYGSVRPHRLEISAFRRDCPICAGLPGVSLSRIIADYCDFYNRFCLQGTDQSPPRSALLTANWRACEGGPCGRGCRPIRFSDRKIAARRSIASVTTGCLPTPTAPAISHWPVISSAYPIQARQAKAMAPKMVPNTKSGTLVLAAAGA
jgi:hypothetical protein